ncbi:MAG: type II toxin-antitoxin system HicB family antitoxin [Candidatus Eremiobacteraeota bacterium]|nr:type II toxin-antitoxin system HicB family antitoxin [Candidatus Eremiobacteraeota bacterium]
MTYQAIFEQADDGTIWGYAPEIPGATGSGDTIDEARISLVQGIQTWMEVARERGVHIPKPITIAVEELVVSAP